MDFIAREHPAFVHVPLGLVVIVPLALFISYRSRDPHIWIRKSLFIAVVGLAGSALTLYTGLLWARLINLVPTSGYFPASTASALQKVMQRHEVMALVGAALGLITVLLLWRALSRPGWREAALAASLAWASTWAITGRHGGTMVFGDPELNKAAAERDAAQRKDAEAELPIRALDFASLDPMRPVPFLTKAHGARFGQVWVPASGKDAYQAGNPIPVGAYAVMNTFEASKGKPTYEPGPLYMRETKADGSQAFAFYWARVPEGRRAEAGGEDSVYWRSPSPQAAACAKCHTGAGPASAQ